MTDSLRHLISAARAEVRLTGVGLTDAHSMREVIWAAFRSEIAPRAELTYQQEVSGDRLLGRLTQAHGESPDILIVANPARLVASGMVQSHEQPYRDRYPTGWIDSAGTWSPIYVQPVVAIYNQYHVTLPPAEWADLADPDRVGKLVLEEPWAMLTSGPALAELSSVFGPESWGELIHRMGAGAPLIVADNERSAIEVATGSRHTGLCNWNVAIRLRATSPVRHVLLNPTPCIPGFAVLPTGGPSPNLARLFLAWLGSPGGQRAYAATGRIPAMPGVGAPISLSTVLPVGVEPLFGTVDWLGQPDRWVKTYRECFRAPQGPPRRGKLSST